MKSLRFHLTQQMLDGTIRVFAADALILPTGMLAVAYLTRRLGPDGFGSFAIASSIVLWIEASINTIFHRPTLKTIADHKDWTVIAPTIVRMHFRVSLSVTVLVWLLSPAISTILRQNTLMAYLWLFSLDIPLAGVTDAHRNLLVGIGAFRQRAFSSAVRWIGRLLLILALVELGLSTSGAILANLGASLLELTITRLYVRPRLWNIAPLDLPEFWDCFWPLVLFSISVALFSRLDLLALKMLGGSANDAGIYAAAQGLAVVPGLFAMSFSPLLLSTVSRLRSNGNVIEAKEICSDGMRLVFVFLPFAAMAAAMSNEIVDLIFGPLFRAAAPLFSLLIFGAVAMAMISIATAILTAAGKPRWILLIGAALLPFAVAGHMLLIPRLGSLGASAVTVFCASMGALASVGAVYHVWQIFPGVGTLMRALVVCGVTIFFASIWPISGALLIVKLFVLSILICGCFFVLGEFRPSELAAIRHLTKWQPETRVYSN